VLTSSTALWNASTYMLQYMQHIFFIRCIFYNAKRQWLNCSYRGGRSQWHTQWFGTGEDKARPEGQLKFMGSLWGSWKWVREPFHLLRGLGSTVSSFGGVWGGALAT